MNIYVEINLSKNKRNILRTIVPMYAISSISIDSLIKQKKKYQNINNKNKTELERNLQ